MLGFGCCFTDITPLITLNIDMHIRYIIPFWFPAACCGIGISIISCTVGFSMDCSSSRMAIVFCWVSILEKGIIIDLKKNLNNKPGKIRSSSNKSFSSIVETISWSVSFEFNDDKTSFIVSASNSWTRKIVEYKIIDYDTTYFG